MKDEIASAYGLAMTNPEALRQAQDGQASGLTGEESATHDKDPPTSKPTTANKYCLKGQCP
ncbi:MAG: hypothetical protein ABSB91_03745 [Sedimentisphaerales bacterium]